MPGRKIDTWILGSCPQNPLLEVAPHFFPWFVSAMQDTALE